MSNDFTHWQKSKWTKNDYQQLLKFLHAQSDPAYRHFNEKILKGKRPTLGVRLSILRPLSKAIAQNPNLHNFLQLPKGNAHEEVLLEGMVISHAKLPYSKLLPLINHYVTQIDSWALCDCFVSRPLLAHHQQRFWFELPYYLKKNAWSKRFAFIVMMTYYLDRQYLNKVFAQILNQPSNHYYVQMAQAWLLATAFIKFRPETITFLTTHQSSLGHALIKMTTQKIRDSRRVSSSDKIWTKTLPLISLYP
jgi:3-methyladenine DNA glycosylase AlkD